MRLQRANELASVQPHPDLPDHELKTFKCSNCGAHQAFDGRRRSTPKTELANRWDLDGAVAVGYTAAFTDGGQLRVETTATETIINQKQFSNLTSSLKSNCSEWSRPSTLTRSTPKQPY
jgi:hypothetical protein